MSAKTAFTVPLAELDKLATGEPSAALVAADLVDADGVPTTAGRAIAAVRAGAQLDLRLRVLTRDGDHEVRAQADARAALVHLSPDGDGEVEVHLLPRGLVPMLLAELVRLAPRPRGSAPWTAAEDEVIEAIVAGQPIGGSRAPLEAHWAVHARHAAATVETTRWLQGESLWAIERSATGDVVATPADAIDAWTALCAPFRYG